jgi:signal transduction histidine kinase
MNKSAPECTVNPTAGEAIITYRLGLRSSRPPEHAQESSALRELAEEMAAHPKRIPQRIAELTLKLCRVDSAAVSVLEPGGANGVFRWEAAAGLFASHVGKVIRKDSSPLAAVVDRKSVQLFREPDRFFPALREYRPTMHEALIAPCEVEGRLVAAVWAIAHHEVWRERLFDSEDARVLSGLACFAAASWSLVERTRATQELRAERSAALNLMEDAVQSREALNQSRADLERALQNAVAARQDAETANRTKDLFLATLSHELRTPLTPVLMATHSILRHKDLPPRVREALEMIARNVEIETRFVDDLLDLTRIARGKFELVRGRVDLHEVLRRAAEVAAADLQAKAQQFVVELQAEDCLLDGDFVRLQQAFWNLLKNASKFTPEGGLIRITSGNQTPGFVQVEVSDTGRGIDASVLPDIFNPFHQGGEEIGREFGGLGLGLAIAKATVVAHDGTIVAASRGRDQGATFTVSLPLPSATEVEK